MHYHEQRIAWSPERSHGSSQKHSWGHTAGWSTYNQLNLNYQRMVWEDSIVRSNSTMKYVKARPAITIVILKLAGMDCLKRDTIEIDDQKSTHELFKLSGSPVRRQRDGTVLFSATVCSLLEMYRANPAHYKLWNWSRFLQVSNNNGIEGFRKLLCPIMASWCYYFSNSPCSRGIIAHPALPPFPCQSPAQLSYSALFTDFITCSWALAPRITPFWSNVFFQFWTKAKGIIEQLVTCKRKHKEEFSKNIWFDTLYTVEYNALSLALHFLVLFFAT